MRNEQKHIHDDDIVIMTILSFSRTNHKKSMSFEHPAKPTFTTTANPTTGKHHHEDHLRR
jgi:hypothetical protein